VTNGNDLKKEAIPFSLTLPVPPPGAEGGNNHRGEAASAQSKPAISAPHRILGAEMSRNKQRRERSDPPRGDGSASDVTAWMLARRLPVAVSGISGRKGAVGRRGATGAKRSLRARDGGAGMPEESFRVGQKSPWMAPVSVETPAGQGNLPPVAKTPPRAVYGAGRAYALVAGNLPCDWSNLRA
jgi:hypothetical protein